MLLLPDELAVWVLCIFPPACAASTATPGGPARLPGDGRQSSCFGVLHGVASES